MLEYGKEFRIIVICVAFFNMMRYRTYITKYKI